MPAFFYSWNQLKLGAGENAKLDVSNNPRQNWKFCTLVPKDIPVQIEESNLMSCIIRQEFFEQSVRLKTRLLLVSFHLAGQCCVTALVRVKRSAGGEEHF